MHETRLTIPSEFSILENARDAHDKIAVELIERAGHHLQVSSEIAEALETHAVASPAP